MNTAFIKGEYFTIFPLNCTKLNTLVKPIDLLSEACKSNHGQILMDLSMYIYRNNKYPIMHGNFYFD